ncbi:hypothetical protein GCM10009676_08380 [Prauserella halophila]|uniref:Uncharacterized protein n=1 Tax=Prauserella halophila TaxID=185641 RepID=A0ABN1VZ80_9PSEU|nr:hypothetical protein [Prauserella halophila]MCP2235202.1 hypothetical protein [Prauserella halophila]
MASVLELLEGAGLYRPPVGRLCDLEELPPVADGHRELTDVLSDMRDEERW